MRVSHLSFSIFTIMTALTFSVCPVAFAAPPEPVPRPERHLSAAEIREESLHSAFEAADHDQWAEARRLASGNALATDLIDWRYLVDSKGEIDFQAATDFLKKHPDWPALRKIQARAEAAMDPDMPAAQVAAWFAGREPVTSLGRLRLGKAQIALGREDTGAALLCRGWTYGRIPVTDEKLYADLKAIPAKCQRARLDNLLWRGDWHRVHIQSARVDIRSRRLAEAREAVQRGFRSASQHIKALPASLRTDPALTFDRARAFRRRNMDDEAEALLNRLQARRLMPDHARDVWLELAIAARSALRDHRAEAAYQLVNDRGFSPDENTVEYADAEFLAGWIALRKLHRPEAALHHFRNLSREVGRPISLARGAYWQGRALQKLGRIAGARAAYQRAASHPETYYGQLAMMRLAAAPRLSLTASHVPLPPAEAFAGNEMIRALKMLAELDQKQAFRAFALQYHKNHPDGGHSLALIRLSDQLGFRHIAVRLAKLASYDGYMFPDYAYPLIEVPPYHGEGPGPEPALVLALIRQETEFNARAISPAGAQGLMQVMPKSARRYARHAGVPYSRARLLYDTGYNVRLGMTMIAEYWRSWNFVLPLGAASYNAGPAATERWIRNNGDPRADDVDAIDWIEEIPYSETRNYVQRVLENVQIYRARLAGHAVPLKIYQDLKDTPPRPLAPPQAKTKR